MTTSISRHQYERSRTATFRLGIAHVSLAFSMIAMANANLLAQYNGSFVDIQPVPGLETPNTYVRFPNAISDDGLTMWLMHGANKSRAGVDIFKATRSSVLEPFNEIVPIDALNIGHANFAHEVSSDGLSTYFCSAPTSGRPKMWTATRESLGSDWGVPQLFEIDGSDECLRPKLSHDQLTMYFRKNGVSTVRRESATEPFGEPETLPEVPSVSAVSGNELAIMFGKITGGPRDGTQDMMIATRETKDDPFGQPVGLVDFGLGSTFDRSWGYVGDAVLSANWPADGSKLYFSAGRNAHFGQTLTIYEATWNVDQIGDYSADGSLDVEDLNRLTSAIHSGTNHQQYDLDQSGTVDLADRQFWVTDLKSTWIGDANLDGMFDSGDFVDVFATNKYETGETATWSEGDWNGDERFDSGDFVVAFADGGYEMGTRTAAAVPEPSSWVLLTLSFVSVGLIRRRSTGPWSVSGTALD